MSPFPQFTVHELRSDLSQGATGKSIDTESVIHLMAALIVPQITILRAPVAKTDERKSPLSLPVILGLGPPHSREYDPILLTPQQSL